MKVLPCGDRGLLLEVEDLDAVLTLYAALQNAALPGVVDLVPAARTVLVKTDGRVDLSHVRAGLHGLPRVRHERPVTRTVDVPVTYDGADLETVAALLGMSAEALAQLHSSQLWTVAFSGFAPGFAYLVSTSGMPDVPRRHEPRPHVDRGSVALGGEFTGIYSKDSPGGWQVIGRTALTMWDLDRDPPALLVPGLQARFVEAS